jgi:hypothetical protein
MARFVAVCAAATVALLSVLCTGGAAQVRAPSVHQPPPSTDEQDEQQYALKPEYAKRESEIGLNQVNDTLLDLVPSHGSDITLDSLYAAYIDSKQNEQRLVDRVEALSSQVTGLTNQLIQFFSAAAGPSNASVGLSGLSHVSKLEIMATGGVTFTRWGRTRCDSGATVLYKGYAAGPAYNEAGGGADLLCVHDTPQWYRPITAVAGTSNVWSFSYRDVSGLFDLINSGYLPLDHHIIPCAVCHIQTRSHQIMIPARRECPAGWSREYWGYLLSTHRTYPKGMFTCVDEAPESAGAYNGNNWLYPVESRCPGFKCPPYVNGYEVTCVVCSK